MALHSCRRWVRNTTGQRSSRIGICRGFDREAGARAPESAAILRLTPNTAATRRFHLHGETYGKVGPTDRTTLYNRLLMRTASFLLEALYFCIYRRPKKGLTDSRQGSTSAEGYRSSTTRPQDGGRSFGQRRSVRGLILSLY